ncbi:UNVERIFIED_CONTAM: hypothetical protein Cloal_4097 [Acetivibrio alkalicellulosi]
MNQVRYYRKYPRTHEKINTDTEERTINLSASSALGILALAFVKGMFWGYVIKKKLS